VSGRERLWLLLGMMVIVGAIFYQSYTGRLDLWHSQLHGCQRAEVDRRTNAAGWLDAARARQASALQERGRQHQVDLGAARLYRAISADLLSRVQGPHSRFRCERIYPRPSPFG
jgi:hypothetical protein